MERIGLLAVSGSLRDGSFNTGLLRAFESQAPSDLDISYFFLRGIPMFDVDLEARGDPEPVVAWKRAVSAADVILFATPEYNGGIPGTLKNAIDWASRGDNPIAGKPAAIIGGGGRLATAHAQLMLRHVLSYMGCPILPRPTLFVAGVSRAFDGDELVDEAAIAKLKALGPAIVDWIDKLRA